MYWSVCTLRLDGFVRFFSKLLYSIWLLRDFLFLFSNEQMTIQNMVVVVYSKLQHEQVKALNKSS